MALNYHPVIIIGAGRSGTNMLRDLLTSAPGVETWPCDEINYIWRHGNLTEPSDEFSPLMATENVNSFIRNKFDKLFRLKDCSYIVEKTCANSLRVGFVSKVFPDAKFIHLIRDGRDVVASAKKTLVSSNGCSLFVQEGSPCPLCQMFRTMGSDTYSTEFTSLDLRRTDLLLGDLGILVWKRI